MSLVFFTLLIPLTAFICELIFIFSSAAFMAQDLIFKTVAPIFLKCNSILFLAAIMFLKVDNLENKCGTMLTFYFIVTSYDVYKKLMSIDGIIFHFAPPHFSLGQQSTDKVFMCFC